MSNFEENITNLPEEVILHILQYLPYIDITALRLVCKDFYLISLRHHTVKQEVFIIKEDYIDLNIVPLLMNSTRTFTSFKCIKVNFSIELESLFKKYSHTLLNLYLIDCDITDGYFTNILRFCTKLQSLHLSGCKSLLIAGTLFSVKFESPNLNKLIIIDCSYLTDDIFENFLEICPNIRSINLKSNKICFNTALCRRFYRDDVLTRPSNCVFTICYILKILAKNCNKIKELDFSKTYIDNNSLQKICTLERLNLQKLSLSQCNQLSRYTSLQLGSWQPGLLKLDLSFCNAVTDEVLQNICTYMTKLKTLNIAHCAKISDSGIVYLKNLKDLQVCDVSVCPAVTSAGLSQSFNHDSCLEQLRMQSLQIHSNDMGVTACLNNLTYLDLSNCKHLFDDSLKLIFKNCTKIITLLLSGCVNIGDAGMTGISQESQDGDSANDSIDNLTGLMSLTLKNCRNITESTFHLAMNLSDLRVLDLAGLKLTHTSMDALVKKCPRIEYLNLNSCDVYDSAVILAVMNLKRLKYLYLRNCIRLSDAILAAILEHCMMLQELETVGCYMFSQPLVDGVAALPTLQTFNCSKLINFTNKAQIPVAPPFRM